LRDGGFQGDVTIVGAEPAAPYERPHLSKGYLLGTVPRGRLPLRPAAQYSELAIDLMLGERVVDFGVESHAAVLASGRTLAWDRLCIATGSDARRLPGFDDAIYLRELPAAERLLGVISQQKALDIVGAGFIGCEVAAAARQRGCEVRVYELLAQPLLRVLGPGLGAYLAAVHRSHGVDLRLGATALPEKPTLVAVGSAPRDVRDVDELGRTSTPDVFAAGDGVRFFHPLYGTHIRVEHFQTSQRQGFAVGRTMAGAAQAYDEVPWFWSDQYDLNIQYVGGGLPWDEIVIRGKLGEPPFTVFYLRGGELIAAAGVNDHHTIARARHVMQARRAITRSQMEDPGFDLRRALA
jgi:3-phenylpropionate/trans-cinnamate dioxygenase ferredoxin reductase subunit